MFSNSAHRDRPRIELAGVLAGSVLFAASYLSDFVLYRLGIQGAATIVNEAAIAILGGAILFFAVAAVHRRQCFARAKERAILVAELNHHLRGALSVAGRAMITDDRGERLRLFDEASGQMDRILCELVPTTGQAEIPRYSLSPLDDD